MYYKGFFLAFFLLLLSIVMMDFCLAISACSNHCRRLGSQMVCCRNTSLKVSTLAADDPQFVCRYQCKKDEYQDE